MLSSLDLCFVCPSSLAQGMGHGVDSLQSQRSLCHSMYHVTQLCPRGLTKRTAVSQVGLVVKNPPANAGDLWDEASIPGLGRSPGEGNGNPLQYSCLEKPMDRAAWRATVHGVSQSQTQLKRLSTAAQHSIHDTIQLVLDISLSLKACLKYSMQRLSPSEPDKALK